MLFIDPTGNMGEIAATYLATGWTINFIPVYGQATYVVGWVGVGVAELVNSPVFPAFCDWTANVAAPWVRDEAFPWISNAASDSGEWIARTADSAWNGIKDLFGGGGTPNLDPNDFNKGFDTFRKLKKFLGSPGKGNQWHHIVEQTQIDKSGFDPAKIHNTNNIISVAKEIHQKISAHYSSIQDFTNGMRVRDWLAGQSYQTQYEYGLKILCDLGVIK